MSRLGMFNFTPDEMTGHYNYALAQTLEMLDSNKSLTTDECNKFVEEYTFVAIRKSSLLTRLSKILFNRKDDDANSYVFKLVKVAK